MVSFNPYNVFSTDSTCSIVITGRNCYQYYRLKDYHNLELRHKQIWRKELQVNAVNNFTCHAFLWNSLIVCSDKGDILFCDKDGEFKVKIIESPGAHYAITSIVPIKGEDFIVTNADGYMKYYTATKEMKNPFRLEKDRLPESVDKEDNKFADFIE